MLFDDLGALLHISNVVGISYINESNKPKCGEPRLREEPSVHGLLRMFYVSQPYQP